MKKGRYIVVNQGFLDEVKQRFIDNLNSSKLEVERKFLVKSLPDYLWKYKSSIIEQHYISLNPEIRIRKADEKHLLTFKSEGHLERTEIEIPITRLQFEQLRSVSQNEGIHKTRYFILDEMVVYELDIYNNINNLITVEVEFLNKKEADDFIPPDWFGCEITNIKEFKNKNLSKNGFPRKLICPRCKGVDLIGSAGEEECDLCSGQKAIDINRIDLLIYNKEIIDK